MKLERLVISNCSRINDLDIEVRANLVLIGPNGSGKTTVLQCLDMLLNITDECLPEILSDDFVRDKAKPFIVECVLSDLTDEESSAFADVADAKSGDSLRVRLELNAFDGGVKVRRYCTNGGTDERLSQKQLGAFGWALLMASDLRNLQQGANVLAIDEPEAHLHPSSQRSLVRLLKQDPSQKVIVTHSPTIAGSFEPDEIVVIREDGCASQPRRGFLSGDEGMVARWWVGRRLEPLTAGTVVAVEGPCDRIIVDKVASALGYDLDGNDVVVVETEGCGNMRVVESIFGNGGFGIPLFELVDEDNREDIARRLGADPANLADLAAHHVFISNRDLEDEYVRAIGPDKLWEKFKSSGVFSKHAIRWCRVGANGVPTARDLAEFARNHKVPCSLIAARLIDSETAPKVESVAALLKAALE